MSGVFTPGVSLADPPNEVVLYLYFQIQRQDPYGSYFREGPSFRLKQTPELLIPSTPELLIPGTNLEPRWGSRVLALSSRKA